jgi:hypothetical protein
VLTNVFDDDDFSQPGDKAFAMLAGLDLASFHSYTVRWLPDRVEWWIDGTRVRQELGTLPDDAINVRLNFWAPDSFFSEAYDASLQPAANAQDNQVCFYEVDWVEIRRVQAAVPAVGLIGLWLAAVALALAGAFTLRRKLHQGA